MLVLVVVVLLRVLTEVMLQVKLVAMVLTQVLLLLLPSLVQEVMVATVVAVEEVAVMATPTYQATKVGAVSVYGQKLVQVVQQEQAQAVLMALKVAL
jgi:hypothetical protein